jgi:hypothetical protein
MDEPGTVKCTACDAPMQWDGHAEWWECLHGIITELEYAEFKASGVREVTVVSDGGGQPKDIG